MRSESSYYYVDTCPVCGTSFQAQGGSGVRTSMALRLHMKSKHKPSDPWLPEDTLNKLRASRFADSASSHGGVQPISCRESTREGMRSSNLPGAFRMCCN